MTRPDDNGRELPPPRLLDGPAPVPGSAEELVVAFMHAAKPYQTPPGRRQRLDAALAGGRRARRRPVRSLLKPALALGLLVCAAATVSAHLLDWPRWLAERLPGHEAPAGHTTAPARAHSAPATGAASVLPAPPTEEPVVEQLVVPPAAEVAPIEAAPAPQSAPARSAPIPAPRHRYRAVVAKSSRDNATNAAKDAAPPTIADAAAPTPPPAPARVEPKPTPPPEPAKAARRDTTEEDAALALAALTALRRDHDPARARAMVDAYLRAHPDGSMAEEALAISIEAAAAHHDADAKALAARYLSLYPSGMFRALARKTLRSDAESR